MTTIQLRRQGGAAVMTLPAHVLKQLDLNIGDQLRLETDIAHSSLQLQKIAPPSKKRYSLLELLHGVNDEALGELNQHTQWALEGDTLGREL